MKLEDYMNKRGLSDSEMGEKVDLSRSQVSRLRRGKARPSHAVMARFIKATNGQVKPGDFFEVVK